MIASCSPSSGSNTPPFASKQDEYSCVASVPRNSLIRASRAVWMSWVPQMNRTLDRPNPWVRSPSAAAATTSGWLDRPR